MYIRVICYSYILGYLQIKDITRTGFRIMEIYIDKTGHKNNKC